MDGTETIDLIRGWRVTFEPSEAVLFVRLHPSDSGEFDVTGLVYELWQSARSRGPHHLIVEMQDVKFLSSSLMGELVRLHKRAAMHDGSLRLCCLSPQCAEALHITRLHLVLPTYDTREAALAGH